MRDLSNKLKPAAILLLAAANTFAADVRMSVEPELISLLDRAVLKLEFIDTKGDAIDFPHIDGLDIQYQGPQKQYTIINGKSSSRIAHTYLVTPAKVGDYTIGPVTVKYKGGEETLSAKLRVIKPQNDPEAQELSKMLFSKISTDRSTPFVHEPFQLELKVYVRDGIQMDGRFSLHGGMPESGLDGDLEWKDARPAREVVDGTIYNVYTLSAEVRTLTAGTFMFQPEIQINVIVPRQRRRPYGFEDPFFGDLFGRQETRPVVLDCNKLEIEVRPVPMEGRPESFTGGVGVLDFDVEAGPATLKAGDPVTVKMRISGQGNLEKITPPGIADSHDIKLYDIRTVPTQNPNEVRFEQVLIPTSDTVTEIPEIRFSYFNTKTSDFRTITKGPFPIKVEAGPRQAAQVIATVPSTIRQETEVLGRDIAYLKPQPRAWIMAGDTEWYRTPWFRFLLPLPGALLGIAGLIAARRNQLVGNVALARRQKAPKAARKHVQRAEHALRKRDETAFHQALWDALTEYFGHRLNLAPGEVTRQTVLARIPGEQNALEQLFGTIEQRRYGIQTDHETTKNEMKTLLRQLTATLKKCERMKL